MSNLTKDKILDTAERLIAAQGFAATSLRQIIAEAGVNLASVHYHFGSKEELLDRLILRKIEAVNRERLARLDQLEREYGSGPIPVERVLAAFFEPMIDTACQSPQFVRLMARLYGEGLLPGIIRKHFQPTVNRFVEALRQAMPELSEGELFWRLQFMFGAMSRAIIDPKDFYTGEIASDSADFGLIIRRLMNFLSAGFQAPPVQEKLNAMPATEEVHV